jgi:hypothetical protein
VTLLPFFNLSQHNPHNTIELPTILQGQQKNAKKTATDTTERTPIDLRKLKIGVVWLLTTNLVNHAI